MFLHTNPSRKSALLTNAIAAATLFAASPALADIINVPADFPTIQAAIIAAQPTGDEIIVAPGTYHEAINLLGKEIFLHSSAGRDTTTIDATDLDTSVITCSTNETPDTIIQGFTITGGTGTLNGSIPEGGGMYNQKSSPTVSSCTFIENSVRGELWGYGGGMYNIDSNPLVSNCIFVKNSASG